MHRSKLGIRKERGSPPALVAAASISLVAAKHVEEDHRKPRAMRLRARCKRRRFYRRVSFVRPNRSDVHRQPARGALFDELFPRLRFTKARSDSANGLDRIPFAPGFAFVLFLAILSRAQILSIFLRLLISLFSLWACDRFADYSSHSAYTHRSPGFR